MTAQARPSLAADEPLGTPRPSLGAHLGALGSHLAAWVGTCADYYQAAALYERAFRALRCRTRSPWPEPRDARRDLSQGCDRTNS